MRIVFGVWLFLVLGCVPAHASLAGVWNGVGLCGWWTWIGLPAVERTRLEVRADGEGFVGVLTIGRRVVGERVAVDPETGGRWRFKANGSDLQIDTIIAAPVVDPARPDLAYISVATEGTCAGLHLVRGYKEFHDVCAKVLDLFEAAGEAVTRAERLKKEAPGLLEDYEPEKAGLAVLADRRANDAAYSGQPDRLLKHIADCGKFDPAGSDIETLGRFVLRRASGRRSRRQFWQPGPALEPRLSGDAFAGLVAAQPRIRTRLKADVTSLHDTQQDLVREIETMVRERSAELSSLPPAEVAAYIATINERLVVLRASEHLAEEFGLHDLPRLPTAGAGADQAPKPLRPDQIEDLKAHRTQDF